MVLKARPKQGRTRSLSLLHQGPCGLPHMRPGYDTMLRRSCRKGCLVNIQYAEK